jgi:DNA-binding MarR family transcriptional regulator
MTKPEPVDDIVPYDALNCTHALLRRAARQLTQIYDDALSPVGLTSAQALLVGQLQALGGHPGATDGPTLQALARRLAIQVSALTHALGPLQRDGLVELVADLADRRSKRARLTPLGLERTQTMLALWQTINSRFEATLGTGATEELRTLANEVAAPDFAKRFAEAMATPG